MDTALEQQEQTLDFRKYIGIVFKWWWIIVIPPIVGAIIAAFVAHSMTDIYKAESMILVESKLLLQKQIEGLAVSAGVNERMNAFKEELLSWPKLVELIEKLGLDKGITAPEQYQKLIQSLKETIKLEFREDNIITISAESPDPKSAQDVVQTITEILIKQNVVAYSTEALEAIQFIENQLTYYREKLENSEDELRKFKEAYTISLPVAARVNEQIIDLEIQLNQLLVENTEAHPTVIAMRKKIEQLKGERDKELVAMKAQGIDVQDQEFQAIAYSVPRQQQELARLQRDSEVNQKLYGELLSRLENAKISKKLDSTEEGGRFRVLEPARLPLHPIKPDKVRIVLFGFAIGLGLGVGIVFLLEIGNASFSSVDEAKRQLKLPILGAIPLIDLDQMDKIYTRVQKRAKKNRHEREIEKQKNLGLLKKQGFWDRTLNTIKKMLGL
jgi:uncharacterized protein involved in exopolysaccharide biosynthesis